MVDGEVEDNLFIIECLLWCESEDVYFVILEVLWSVDLVGDVMDKLEIIVKALFEGWCV